MALSGLGGSVRVPCRALARVSMPASVVDRDVAALLPKVDEHILPISIAHATPARDRARISSVPLTCDWQVDSRPFDAAKVGHISVEGQWVEASPGL